MHCARRRVLCLRAAAYPYVRHFDRSQTVVAGRSLVLECRAWGWLPPTVTWFRGGQQLTRDIDSRVTLSQELGRPNGSRLIIDGVEETDRAYYTCVATSDEWDSQDNATVLVRVKGKLTSVHVIISDDSIV